jgi:hypothetical protein
MINDIPPSSHQRNRQYLTKFTIPVLRSLVSRRITVWPVANVRPDDDYPSPARSPAIFHPELQAIIDQVTTDRQTADQLEQPIDPGEELR